MVVRTPLSSFLLYVVSVERCHLCVGTIYGIMDFWTWTTSWLSSLTYFLPICMKGNSVQVILAIQIEGPLTTNV